MSHYLLRDIPDEIHAAALERARAESRTLRWVLVQMLVAYGSGAWSPPPSAAAPARTPRRPRLGRRSSVASAQQSAAAVSHPRIGLSQR